ncbi:MAG: helix-turn-helix transcriptional regulator, partial [Spirochaetaceae bacterium]|nr:helix-turn-helix transcriptional regulator [Spirochaetaceae bacterium]
NAVPASDRHSLVYLFGAAYAFLARRRLAPSAALRPLMDMRDLADAPDAGALALAARARFSRIAQALRGAPRGSPAVAAVVAHVKENFARPLTLESVADLVSISPSRLSRLFAEETGRGFSEFLIEYRIEKAKEMLASPGASVKQVSSACGYPDPNYFSRLFKKETGLTPSAFSTGIAEANDDQ